MSEQADFYMLTKRKAKKSHKCCECRGIINKGETYNYHFGIWDGECCSFKVCNDCENLRKEVIIDCLLLEDEHPAFTCLGDDLEGYHLEKFNEIKEKRREI